MTSIATAPTAEQEWTVNDMRLINEIAYQERLAKIPMEERTFRKAVEVAEDMPTVDSVEVVRCKDCKHYKPQKKSAHWENRTNYCNRIVTTKVQPYDFCSYGERKDGA